MCADRRACRRCPRSPSARPPTRRRRASADRTAIERGAPRPAWHCHWGECESRRARPCHGIYGLARQGEGSGSRGEKNLITRAAPVSRSCCVRRKGGGPSAALRQNPVRRRPPPRPRLSRRPLVPTVFVISSMRPYARSRGGEYGKRSGGAASSGASIARRGAGPDSELWERMVLLYMGAKRRSKGRMRATMKACITLPAAICTRGAEHESARPARRGAGARCPASVGARYCRHAACGSGFGWSTTMR